MNNYNTLLLSAYQQNQWIFFGSQSGCTTLTPTDKIRQVYARLQRKRENGIEFNPKKISGVFTEKGTCSSMSFEFVDRYFKFRKSFSNRLNTNTRKLLLNRIREIGKEFKVSSEDMRVRQAAFNTIEVKKSFSVDFAKNKVQSLLNFHNLKISDCSPEFDTLEIKTHELENLVDNLPEGAYVVRILKPANNEKLEEYGHTFIYIKEQGLNLCYEPNYGAKKIAKKLQAATLHHDFQIFFQDWQVRTARFYKIEPASYLERLQDKIAEFLATFKLAYKPVP